MAGISGRSMWVVSAAAAVVVVGGALAQEQTVRHAPDGGTVERIQSIVIPPTANAPFTATVVTEWSKPLPDGTATLMKNHRTVARDSAGRTFQQRRFFGPNGDVEDTRIGSVEYTDPYRHELYVCQPERKVCSVYPYYPPPAARQSPSKADSPSVEDLGTKQIGELEALGSREITTIPAGALGNRSPEPVVKEFWYSPHLGINLVTKRFDPRSGTQNFDVRNVVLTEPDPALLTPPTEYRIVRVGTQPLVQ